MEINLLPEEQEEKLRLMRFARRLGYGQAIIVLATTAIVGYLVFIRLSFSATLAASASKSAIVGADQKVKDLEKMEARMAYVRQLLKKSRELDKVTHVPWSGLLRELSSFANPATTLETLSVSGDNFEKIKLTGKAESRDDVIKLKENLERSDYYQEVISPISNMTLKEDVTFEFNMTIKKF